MKFIRKGELSRIIGISRKTMMRRIEDKPDLQIELDERGCYHDLRKQRIFTIKQSETIIRHLAPEKIIPKKVLAEIKPYTAEQLCRMYQCNYRTLREFMHILIGFEMIPPYNTEQVRQIFNELGRPERTN